MSDGKNAENAAAVVVNIFIWSRIEPCCSVVAACLPTLGPFFQNGHSPASLVENIRSIFSSRGSTSSLAVGSRKVSEDSKSAARGFAEDGQRQWDQERKSGTVTISGGTASKTPKDHALQPIEAEHSIMVQKSFASEYEEQESRV